VKEFGRNFILNFLPVFLKNAVSPLFAGVYEDAEKAEFGRKFSEIPSFLYYRMPFFNVFAKKDDQVPLSGMLKRLI
jgi:hypothetical protein